MTPWCLDDAVHARLQAAANAPAGRLYCLPQGELAELANNMEYMQTCTATWAAAYKKHQASQ